MTVSKLLEHVNEQQLVEEGDLTFEVLPSSEQTERKKHRGYRSRHRPCILREVFINDLLTYLGLL